MRHDDLPSPVRRSLRGRRSGAAVRRQRARPAVRRVQPGARPRRLLGGHDRRPGRRRRPRRQGRQAGHRPRRPTDFELREDGVAQKLGSFTRVSRGGGIGVNVGAAGSERRHRRDAAVRPAAGGDAGSATTSTRRSPRSSSTRCRPRPSGMCQQAALEYLPMSGNSANARRRLHDRAVRSAPLQVYTDNPTLVRNAVRRVIPAGTESKEQQREALNALRDRRDAARDARSRSCQGAQQGGAAALGAASGIGQTKLQRRLVQGQMRMLQAFDTLDRDQRGYVTTKSLFAILQSLVELPGRKTLIFFSEGLPASPALQRAPAARSSRPPTASNITVYAIDASGLRAVSGTPDTRARDRGGGQGAAAPAARIARRLHRSADDADHRAHRGPDAVRLAGRPGASSPRTPAASWCATPTTCAGRFERIDEDKRFHYLLTYSPKNQNFDGTFRNIARQGDAPGRAGVRAQGLPRAALRADAARCSTTRRRPSPRSTPRACRTGSRSDTAALNFPEPTRPGLSPLLVRLKTDVLTYEEDAGQAAPTTREATVVVRVRDGDGRVVHKMSQQYQLTGRLHELPSAKQGEILFYREPELPPGLYTVEVVVFDAIGARSSTRVADAGGAGARARRLQMSSVVCVQPGRARHRRDEGLRPTRSTSTTCSSTRTAARPTRARADTEAHVLLHPVSGRRRRARCRRTSSCSATARCWPGCPWSSAKRRRAGPHPAGRPPAARAAHPGHLPAARHRHATATPRSSARPTSRL